jgi:cellulose synthase/poly-beta-1,6-N-acetylglucosamine synthase-like glycosyltransferase
MLLLR